MNKTIYFTIISLLLFNCLAISQHRGDNLSFQGLPLQDGAGVKSAALANAYTSRSGDVNSIFSNPAGLADIQKFQFTIAANSTNRSWRENQAYRPNRMFWTLAFYLEGLYIPDPANNGVWDYELAKDTSYVVREPETGLDPYSEEAADWQEKLDDAGLNNFALAFPFKISNQSFVISAAYSHNSVSDFDRNDTYLDPHIGFDEYGIVERVVTDTAHFSWSEFERKRTGDAHNYSAAVAYKFKDKLNIGIGFTQFSSKTDDFQLLSRVGSFDIANNNRFRFSYDTLNVKTNGTSEFSANRWNVGFQYKLNRIQLGMDIIAPYTVTRDWSTTVTTTDAVNESSIEKSGQDKFEIPASYALGASITPVDQFIISLDYSLAKYSDGTFEISSDDTTHRDWADQSILSLGIEYRPFKFLSLLAGYSNITEVFVPDGAAIKDRGPAATIYTLGASIQLQQWGRLDIAYQMKRLKYYDSYFSNTNYVYESGNNVMVGYTFTMGN